MLSWLSLSMTSTFLWRACQPHTIWRWQPVQRFSLSAVYRFEDFLDKEFAKAQRDLDTETLDNPGSLLRKLERDQNRRILATKRARTARLFQPPKEPRSITWDTIEQIRYLKQENGSEWTTKKLAASFDVTEAVIVKVLKSKFAPTEKTLRKQDERAKINDNSLLSVPAKTAAGTRRTGNEKALLPAFPKTSPTSIAAPPTVKTPINAQVQNKTDKAFPRRDSYHHQQKNVSGQRSVGKLPLKEQAASHPAKPYAGKSNVQTRQRQHLDDVDANFRKSHNVGGQQSQDPNQVRMEQQTEQEGLEDEEELNIDMANLASYADGMPPAPILQRGNEFFDENGEFLYRL